jgi:hypothetical protein
MDYWQGVLSRMNIVSIVLIAAGAALSFGARKLAPLVFGNKRDMVLPVKMAGLLLVVVGALITMF